ncbi:hypothetical protein LWI28_029264 [Acer negundo]|uniref:Uncharacterized protein n=1 Tax=Acer negundo TaxID=4023 RepID=A0AAD5IPD9_ACENE|nr:hypothetical protein LWI28_029264 [Acer negundo]
MEDNGSKDLEQYAIPIFKQKILGDSSSIVEGHQSILLRDAHNVTTLSDNAYLGVEVIDGNASIEKEKSFVQDNQYLRLQEDELEG